ncbi:carboxyl transferase domain-containing protein [Desulforhopalus singaporensis]|uniref:acetyl-CoA carboxylase n=1 Tax=Desulforhopalus singaporensis TaxID=91360 RepID=A0A1H0UZM1_9BACT|nr:carboxyl transferase domain-containing protein [Desulforhopalus singaporensis]SDP71712.1 Pyruvate carboxylase [Desulforhopalus singaporensis]
MKRILIANRGEVAIRIIRAARQLGIETVAVSAKDDVNALHFCYADQSYELPAAGAAAYLDHQALIDVALKTGCSAVHPGYGFLSENADFARSCAAQSIRFIGPAPEILDLFGSKVKALQLAHEVDVPVMPGTSEPTSLDAARTFAEEHGAVMLKALAGGGGRGMRVVLDPSELEEAYERCRSEALQAFGNGDLYVEKLLIKASHIEVQVVGDGSGKVCHLWERDCTVQRRHQKLLEIAPSPTLDRDLRDRILDAAVRLASHVKYDNIGTFEFLVSENSFWFMEANPRLQVEHTVTEEVTGVDLVQTQIHIASGFSLEDLGLQQPPVLNGFAIQARVNLEEIAVDGTTIPKAGLLKIFAPPSGPGIRVDTYGYSGYQTSLRYDSLIAKVIGRGTDFVQAIGKVAGALSEFHIANIPSNIPLLRAILGHQVFMNGDYSTTFISDYTQELHESMGNLINITPPLTVESDQDSSEHSEAAGLPDDYDPAHTILTPMQGFVLAMEVAVGDEVCQGDVLMVIEAMKMEHVVRAEYDGVVTAICVNKGDAIKDKCLLLVVEPSGLSERSFARKQTAPADEEQDWSAEVAEINQRLQFAYAMGGPDNVAKQKAKGKLTARERIDALADEGSFTEIGALTGFSKYDENGNLISLQPANFIAGLANIAGQRVTLGVDDFTLRAGSGDSAIHEKQIFLENYAREMRLPVVRLLDGASGGGSVKLAMEKGFHYLPVNPGWDAVVENLSLVPVISACLGPTVGLGAARLVMSHFAIMVRGTSQIFSAGPPVVKGTTGEDISAAELGGADVHANNGMVERIVDSETEAFEAIRAFLSYLPRNVDELPKRIECTDPVDRRDDRLLKAVPHNERTPYDLQVILESIFDQGSLFTYAEYGGSTITALTRLDGYPVGVLASNPFKGAIMSVEGAQALTRFIDLCETFHLPIVSLTDQGGVSIGSEAEKLGTIRYGVRAISAVYQAKVPQAEVILRRVFGVGGAGMVNRHRAASCWSWPSGTWGSLPSKGGIEAAFRAYLNTVEDREAELERLNKEMENIASPFRTAEHFGVQNMIDPRDSRPLLCEWVKDAYYRLPQMLGKPSFGTRP